MTYPADLQPTPWRPTGAVGQRKWINLVDAVPLLGPLAIYLEPTNNCNFRCVYCPESFKDYEDKAGGLFQLQPDDFTRIADQIKDIGTVEILNFYMMGEPFAHKHLMRHIRLARQRGTCTSLLTTWTYSPPEDSGRKP